jgi:WD40 repeat protein
VGHLGQVNALAFSPDGRLALTASAATTVRVWEVASGLEVGRFIGHTEHVLCATFTPNGRQVLSGGGGGVENGKWTPGRDFVLRLWDVETGREIRTFSHHTGMVQGVAFLDEGRRILSGGNDGTLCLWEVATGTLLQTGRSGTEAIQAFALTGDGRRALVAHWRGPVRLWELGPHRLLEKVTPFEGHESPYVTCAAFAPDGRWALTGSMDRTVRLWDVGKAQAVRVFPHPTGVTCVAWSPDGRRALSASGAKVMPDLTLGVDDKDYSVRLWDVATGRELGIYHSPAMVVRLAFAPDGRQALVGGTSGAVRLLELPPVPPDRQ